MTNIRVFYQASKGLYSGKYEQCEAVADLVVDDFVSDHFMAPHILHRPTDSNLSALEILLDQLEYLRHRTYLRGSIREIKFLKRIEDSND